ncbi:condesin subunit E [Klebsiella oxytoca]|nr:condesin subunit E [Klebsiella oxytoca]
MTARSCRKKCALRSTGCAASAWCGLWAHDSSKFRITESVFRFGADVRAGDDPREAQLRMIRDGEAMALENRLQLNDENEENQPDSGEEE